MLLAFVPMAAMHLGANIMSLGGIAIAIGAMVDASIIIIENIHKRLERWEAEGRPTPRTEVIVEALQEVGRPIFFSLLVITVSFLPVFTLEATEGRLFKPLAFTKTFSMAFAAILAVTLVPAVAALFIRGRIRPEEENPVARLLAAVYGPVCRFSLRFRWPVVLGALLVVAATVPVARRLSSEFMPPLNEGILLYMPTAVPGMSETSAGDVLQRMDRVLKNFPEVERVFGKAGRFATPTDPAPLGMVETVVELRPPGSGRPGETWDDLVNKIDAGCSSPACRTSGGCRSRPGPRCSRRASGARSASRSWDDLEGIDRVAHQIETALLERARNPQRLRRARERRPLPRLRRRSRRGRAPRPQRRGRRGRSSRRRSAARRCRHRRGPRALPDHRPVRARVSSSIPELERVLVATPDGAQIPLSQVAGWSRATVRR